MKKRKIKIIIISCVSVALLLFAAFISSPIINHAASRDIIASISTDDIEAVRDSLKKNRFAINQPPYYPFFATIFEAPNGYPLNKACFEGNIEIIKLLLDNGADINAVSNYSHRAPLLDTLTNASPDRYETAAMLIERGADINVFDRWGDGVLETAVHSKYTDTDETPAEKIAFLKDVLPKMDDSVRSGYAANNVFENAAYKNNRAIFEYLIEEENFDINAVSPEGVTALMYAAKYGNADVCDYLLAQGMDKAAKDNSGKTARDYAEENGFTEIEKLLK